MWIGIVGGILDVVGFGGWGGFYGLFLGVIIRGLIGSGGVVFLVFFRW